jgi:hypothetical protein
MDGAALSTHDICDTLHHQPNAASGEPPKRKPKTAALEITSPHSEGLRTMYPRQSYAVLKRRQQREKQVWTMGYGIGEKPSDTAIRKKGFEVEQHLAVLSGDNATTAVEILLNALSRGTMQDILSELIPKLGDLKGQSEDAMLLDNIRSFNQYHSSEGKRPKVVQDAMDAVVTASVWPNASAALPNAPGVVTEDDNVSKRRVAARLEVSWQKVKSCSDRATQFIRSGEQYCPSTYSQRSDCTRKEA